MLKEIKDKNIKEEGERMVPSYHKGAMVYGEHIVRYEAVEPIIKGKNVLDIASGSGYGTYIIGESAKSVVGVDVDKDSVAYAKKNYSRKNTLFKLGSAEKIPATDNSFDVVVSFETIEHIKNYKKFIEETRRVLKTDGTFVVSTPNDLEFPEGNHFHLHEFTEAELVGLLKNHFKYVHVSYQYTWLYTALMEGEDAASEKVLSLQTANLAPVRPDKAIYFTVVCSNKPITNKVKTLAAISEHWSARQTQENETRRAAEQKAQVKEYEKRIKELKVAKNAAETKLNAIYHSKGWKLLGAVYTTKKHTVGRIKKPSK